MSQKLRCLVIGIPEAKAAEGSLRPEEFASIDLDAFERFLETELRDVEGAEEALPPRP